MDILQLQELLGEKKFSLLKKGDTKTAEELLAEVNKKECSIIRFDEGPIRIVRSLKLQISSPDFPRQEIMLVKKYLAKTKEWLICKQPIHPAKKLKSDEILLAGVRRCLREIFNIDNTQFKFPKEVRSFDEVKSSPSFALETKYETHIMAIELYYGVIPRLEYKEDDNTLVFEWQDKPATKR